MPLAVADSFAASDAARPVGSVCWEHERQTLPTATLPAMAAGDVELVRRAWEAFARGDVRAATDVLHPRVRWYGADAEEPDDGCHSREDALAFIRRAVADGVTVEAFDVRDAGDRVVVLVQTQQPPEWGEQPEPHGEIVTVREGKVVETVVYATVDEALAAGGQPCG